MAWSLLPASAIAAVCSATAVWTHLDAQRRAALFDAVQCLGGQCWYSGTDDGQFNGLAKTAQFVKILPAKTEDGSPVFEVKK